MGENLWEIEIVRENDVFMFPGKSADLRVGSRRISDLRPMECIVTATCQFLNPTRSKVHIDQKTH
jgi:hypothetical protein